MGMRMKILILANTIVNKKIRIHLLFAFYRSEFAIKKEKASNQTGEYPVDSVVVTYKIKHIYTQWYASIFSRVS